ncbi:hypothetical protein LCGC14_2905450 [marine sediment metagenome]|uniref:Uncharacterized protein n=1 Tax=marine sediment metagenome TaxID=412755 RepID=A0A0F8XT38_9ZZZZ
MDSTHTIKHMRDSAFTPSVATREMSESWKKSGSPDAACHARNEDEKILTKENSAVFSKDLDEKIRGRFKGLVTGTAGWKEGFKDSIE